MKVLLLGETGLIGLRLKNSLMAMKVSMVNLCRKDLDFLNADGDKFLDCLDGITVIINAVGIMSDDKITMEQIHHYAPKRFANIAKQYAINNKQKLHWINISAIGADPSCDIAFIGSKGRGDKAILDLADDNFKVTIVRPSLVFSPIGASSKLFLELAKLPLLFLPDGGRFYIQPVHLNDVIVGIIHLIQSPIDGIKSGVINFVGKPLLFCDYLNQLRMNNYHKAPANIITIPMGLVKALLPLSLLLPDNYRIFFNKDNLLLLKNQKVIDDGEFIKLLNQTPLTVKDFNRLF